MSSWWRAAFEAAAAFLTKRDPPKPLVEQGLRLFQTRSFSAIRNQVTVDAQQA
jgi:hypothetical protein